MLFRCTFAFIGAAVLLFVGPAGGLYAEIKLPAIFGDNMVLQRNMAVPVWGQAPAGAKVSVRFRDQHKTATAGKDGKWLLKLAALKAGDAGQLIVSHSGDTLTLNNVVAGDVWVGSGQSNMAGSAAGYAKKDEVLAELLQQKYPQLRLVRGRGGKWAAASPATSPGFSALLFSFGVNLHQESGVPVGLILGAVGGTPSGYWLSQQAFDSSKEIAAAVQRAEKNNSHATAMQRYRKQLILWEKAAAEAKKNNSRIPRKPAEPVKAGQSRGRIGHLYETHIRPVAGFGIRGVLWDQGESGTAIAAVDQFTVMGALIAGWRKDWGQGEFPFLYVQKPSGGGIAWDQKNPVTRMADAAAPLPAKPTGNGAQHALHIKIMQHPSTYMVTATDLGSGVHPVNKSGYGARAARVALGAVYDAKLEIYGPVYKSHEVQGNTIRLRFDHIGKGLAVRGDTLQGFQIAGKDKVFRWADAKIQDGAVVVSNPDTPQPVAVRYAWSRRPLWANLFNKDGLPALTFRTDNW